MQCNCLYSVCRFKTNVWIALFSFVGNYFVTHVFFYVLDCAYTIPPGYELNRVALVFYFMTHAYFMTYHMFATLILRRLNPTSYFTKAIVVFAMAYSTAFMEAFSIQHFPHYVSLSPYVTCFL
eukprot:m.163526 g.163526  ORF g.163526 m.163526 type:complete len:123 (+) comp14391_c0_seq3:794-1162(+)